MTAPSSRLSIFPLLALLVSLVNAAGVTSGSTGFVGYGITLNEPYCAFACHAGLSAPLNCTAADLAVSDPDSESEAASPYPSGDGWAVIENPSPACRSRNVFYQQTLAYCLQSYCARLTVSQIQRWWEDQLPDLADGTGPEPYSNVLASINNASLRPLIPEALLNYTAILPADRYLLHYNDVRDHSVNEARHSLYGLIILITGAAIPIVASMLRFLPWPAHWVTKFNAHLIDPPLIGSKHATPIRGLGIMPTRGQALFLLYLWVVNIVFSCVGYEIHPGSWHETYEAALKRLAANRLGVLAYANVPLVILYAGRNSFLLWLTNWSRSTFLLVHRWAGFICMLHAVMHSLIYLDMVRVSKQYASDFTSPFWYWGCAGTIGFVILTVKSIQPIRQRAYELFLVAHISITAVVIVASYKHVILKSTTTYGYQNWLWMASAIWGFDRLVRIVRYLRLGFKRAYFTPIDEHYYRFDIPNMSADGHVYLHFPTISTWRIWESHPFSVAGVTYLDEELPVFSPSIGYEKEKQCAKDTSTVDNSSSSGSEHDGCSSIMRRKSGIAVFIRRQSGLTAALAAKRPPLGGIPVFVEGSYNQRITCLQEDHPEPTHDFPNLLCIAGGVGITGVLSALDRFNTAGRPLGTKKLFWGVRSWPLVREVERMQLEGVKDQGTLTSRRWGDVDVRVAVDERHDVRRILTRELRQQIGGTVVVVCGPSSMVDDVRCILSALARHDEDGKPVVAKLMIESFTW